MSRRPADRGVAYFAAFLDLLRKRVLVVGGGKIATAKVRALLPCRPWPLVVVAPRASVFIRRAAACGELEWLAREYVPDDMRSDVALAFGATNERGLNAQVAGDARRLGVPVLAVDDVPNCDFIAPALVRRGDVSVAISTHARSPAMARRTRELLDQSIPSYWGELLDVAAEARDRLGATRSLVDPERWQAALSGDVERLVAAGALERATQLLVARLERTLFEGDAEAHPHPRSARPLPEGEALSTPRPRALAQGDAETHPHPRSARPLPEGEALSTPRARALAQGEASVSLVGAGPGDPELLTLRALQCLQAADVVVHDRLVSDEVLAFSRDTAERIDVGKAPGGGGWSQSAINTLLMDLAQAGKRVVRLKGGDPFVFGRGGEEALALARRGIPVEVVPGVSSALAAPAAVGIPVTHRGLSSSVTIINGHDVEQHDWSVLAASRGTLVFLMAVERLEDIVDRLIDHGRATDEPAAVIESASTSRQRSVHATLIEIAAHARAQGIQAPAVLVVGQTGALAGVLGSTSPRPLGEVARSAGEGALVAPASG